MFVDYVVSSKCTIDLRKCKSSSLVFQDEADMTSEQHSYAKGRMSTRCGAIEMSTNELELARRYDQHKGCSIYIDRPHQCS